VALDEEVDEEGRQAVQDFLATHDDQLAARTKREVRNKLMTGLKHASSRARAPEAEISQPEIADVGAQG
jgi:hypothetical protein